MVLAEEEVETINIGAPHVVILGAGASRACCPQGDNNGKQLPVMKDLVSIVGLKSKLEEWNIDPTQNFEDVFSSLYEKNENAKLNLVEQVIEDYFKKLELPNKPTIYDHLVLSLRNKDLIATFNWDPLLLQAYARSWRAGLRLPQLAFLHGNVGAGYCEQDRKAGLAEDRCSTCNRIYNNTPLLYPIKIKNYASNAFIRDSWERLKLFCEHASILTIFGYSAPKTDTEAIKMMKEAWDKKSKPQLELHTFITKPNCNNDHADESYYDTIRTDWSSFIQTRNCLFSDNFYSSNIANHPRRTCEAYWEGGFLAKWPTENPIPRDLNLVKTWRWFSQFKNAEDESNSRESYSTEDQTS